MSSKTKSARKVRESGRGGAGEIFVSESLELPYILKPVRPQESGRDKDQPPRMPRTPAPGNSGRSSPTASWEDPRQAPQEQDPTPLSFCPKPAPTQPQPLAPRESSYSAILLGTDKQKAKNTAFAKVNPEIKRVEKPLGVIGQKTTSPHGSGGGLGALRGISGPAVTVATAATMAAVPLLPTPDHHPAPSFSPHPLKDDYTRSLYPGHVDPPSPPIHSWDPKTLSAPPALRPPPGLPQQGHDTGHRHPTLQGEYLFPCSHTLVVGNIGGCLGLFSFVFMLSINVILLVVELGTSLCIILYWVS